MSSDPIGIAGGLRSQGYVDGPNAWVDPFGLEGIHPNNLNFSQVTVGKNVNSYIQDMKLNQLDWSRSGPLRVIERNGSLVSYDNRRLYAARASGQSNVPIERVNGSDINLETGNTWDEDFDNRLKNNKLCCKGTSVIPKIMNRKERMKLGIK